MLSKTKTAIFLVLCLLLTLLLPTSVSNETENYPVFTFDQEDGYHVDSELNLSGQSSFPLTSIEISIWNISLPDQWSQLSSNPFLDSVVPFTDEVTDSTMWSWQHSYNLSSVDCTCYVEISLMEHTNLTSFGLIVYVGDEHHRPVLRPSSTVDLSQFHSTQIFNSNSIDLAYEVLIPPSHSEPGTTMGLNIIPDVRICPVSNGICLESYVSIATSDASFDEELQLVVDMDNSLIDDGFYLLQVQIQDEFLKLSNNLTQFVIIDQTEPTVELTAVEQVFESESIVVDIDVNDGYIGSTFVITWTITEPDGTPRSVLDSEILEDSRLGFKPTKSGQYSVNALVRDLGGHLVVVNHNVSVFNIAPDAVVRYDGFLVQDGSQVTIPQSGNWVFSANESTDSESDITSLEYYWYVDGKTLLSGKSYLTSSDIQATTYREIRVEVVDDDGESSNLSFDVIHQQSESLESFADTTLASMISLFFILFIAIIVFMRQRGQSDKSSGFVKWTERGKKPKN